MQWRHPLRNHGDSFFKVQKKFQIGGRKLYLQKNYIYLVKKITNQIREEKQKTKNPKIK